MMMAVHGAGGGWYVGHDSGGGGGGEMAGGASWRRVVVRGSAVQYSLPSLADWDSLTFSLPGQ